MKLILVTMVLSLMALVGYGLYLAFSASLVLGVIVLMIEPIPLLLGVIGIVGHPEVSKLIANWLGL